MKKICWSVLIFIAILSYSKIVHADCYCACMNGENQPFCDSTLDLPPLCPSRVCQIETPSIEPLPSLDLPPIGTTYCQQEQVYDDYEGRYVWRNVCY